MKKSIKGYKGFNKDMVCRGFQFEVGKTYKTDRAKCCESGFHLCENPMDIFSYCNPADSIFAEAEATGEIDTHSEDSKVATTEIKIGAKVDLHNLIKAGVEFIFSKVEKTKNETAYKTIEKILASNTGYQSAASNTGYQSAASVSGKQSIACGLGIENKVKGKLTCWLVLAEWQKVDNEWRISHIKTAMVDGIKIKEDVWYELKNGEFVEAK